MKFFITSPGISSLLVIGERRNISDIGARRNILDIAARRHISDIGARKISWKMVQGEISWILVPGEISGFHLWPAWPGMRPCYLAMEPHMEKLLIRTIDPRSSVHYSCFLNTTAFLGLVKTLIHQL